MPGEFDKKYLIILPMMENMKQGAVYETELSLPLHCTVLQWFLPGKYFVPDHLEEKLRAFIKKKLKNKHFDLVSDRPALFGPNSDIPVHILKQNPAVELLHTTVLLHLAEHGGNLPEDLKWVGAGYRPHVTDTVMSSFRPGTTYRARKIALLGRNEYGDRKVLFIIPR